MYQNTSCISWPLPAISFHSASGPYSITGAKKNSRELLNSSVNSSISMSPSRFARPHAALDVIDRRIARDVPLEPIERLVLVVLDQHLAIEVVELLERAGERQRAADLAAELGDAREVAQRGLEARHLVEAEVADDEIVDVVGERQLRHRALGAEEHALLAERAEVGDLAARDIEHRARRIDRDQARAFGHPAQDLDRRVAGAARDVEHLTALGHREVAQQHLAETRAPDRRDLFIVDARQLLDFERALLLDVTLR